MQNLRPQVYSSSSPFTMKLTFAAFVVSLLSSQAYALPAAHEVCLLSIPCLMTILITTILTSLTQARAAQTCGSPTVALLRGYSNSAKDHFYTTDAVEMETALVKSGYASEGDAGFVFPTQAPDTIPLYRLYNRDIHDHFYTTSASERDTAISRFQYSYEGITAYVYASALCGSVPLYRVQNPTVQDHFYTTDAAEKNTAIGRLGYVDEGIAAYVIQA